MQSPVEDVFSLSHVLDWLRIERYYSHERDSSSPSEKKEVVLANGCFDVLHRGHLDLLRKARNSSDSCWEDTLLVVAINSDDSVRRLKGESRPIHNHNDRAYVLRETLPVSYVVVFDEDTPLKVIEAIRPDVLVRGDEGERPVGADFVESYGGRVVLVEKLPGFSTTGVVQKMKE